MADSCDETRRYDHVLTRRDLDDVNKSLSSLRSDIREDLKKIAERMEEANERHAQMDIWRAQIDLRLQGGVERMNSLQTQIDARIKKETVVALLAGAMLVGGGSGAVLMKLLGG